MTDPKRMRDERGGSWEARLIDAMRSEKPPTRSRQRVLAAVAGAGATTALGWTARAAAARVLMHWSVWVGSGSLVALGAAHVMASRPSAPSTTAAASSQKAAPPTVVLPPVATSAPEAPAPEPSVSSSAPKPRPAAEAPRALRVAPAPTVAVTSPAMPTPSAAETLRDEITSLYAIKRALDAHDPQNALRALNAHEQRFSTGSLKTEASVLRVETWLQIGDTAHAAALGQMIIDQSPNGPYARRIRSMLDRRRSLIDEGTGGQWTR